MNKQYQLGFIVERALGHATHGQNLQAAVATDTAVLPAWAFPEQAAAGLVGKIPNWTVSAGLQARRSIEAMQQTNTLDALFFHTQVTATLCLDWMRRIPSVVSLDATPLQYDSLGDFYAHEQGPAWLERGKRQLNKACFHAAHHLVTWSAWAKGSLVADYHIPADKITVIPPGVHTAEWQRPPTHTADPDRPLRILFVGGNLARKGGLVLLEAFQALRERVGSGEWRVASGEWRVMSGDAPPPPCSPATAIELHLVTKDPIPPQPGVFVYHDMEPNSPAL